MNIFALPALAPVVLRDERIGDIEAREALLDLTLGEDRLARTSERLREGRVPARALALAAERDGVLVGTLRLWEVSAGGVDALLLGPLAVSPDIQASGVGTRLMREAIWRAATHGHAAILLVGDAPYYGRFGFSARHTAALTLPGPVDRARFLGLELQDGALSGANGMVVAGRRQDMSLAIEAMALRRAA